jgi:hypothetical protein
LADNNEVEIKITLDDGSVVKGIANIQKSIRNLPKETKPGTDDIAKQFDRAFGGSLAGGFIDKIKSVNPILLGAAGAAAAFVGAFKLSIIGEEIQKINSQFTLLASQSGLASESLANGLIKSAQGLVDTEDILKSASGAIVALGENADRLPEVFDIARRASNLFGIDTIQAFETINAAVASGSTRQLRSLGLIIDSDKVYKDYAKTLGITSDLLTTNQKQQALLDAVIAKGSESFKNVSEEASALSNSYTRLKVSIGELVDTTALLTKESTGGFFQTLFKATAEEVDKLNLGLKVLNKSATLDEKINLTEKLKVEAEQNLEFAKRTGDVEEDNISRSLEGLNRELAILKEQRDLREERAFQGALKASANKPEGSELGLTPEQISAANAAKLALEQEYISAKNQLQQQALSAEIANAQFISDEELRRAELDRLAKEQRLLEDELFEQKKAEIALKYSTEKGFTDAQRDALELAARRVHLENLEKIENDSGLRRRKQENDLSQSLTSIRDAGLKNVFKATATALANGENAFKVFGKGILSLMGNILMEMGASLILIGLSMEAIRNSIIGLTGGPAIFAGVALLGLGALLSKLGGGSSAPSSTPSIPTSGGTSSSSDIQNPAADLNEAIPEKTTKVAIDVQGTVLDPIAVGRQISQILTDTFEATGTRVVQV